MVGKYAISNAARDTWYKGMDIFILASILLDENLYTLTPEFNMSHQSVFGQFFQKRESRCMYILNVYSW